jgi:hypothetical protein
VSKIPLGSTLTDIQWGPGIPQFDFVFSTTLL